MDDARIRQLTDDVMQKLRPGAESYLDLAARVAALEASVRRIEAAISAGVTHAAPAPAAIQVVVPQGAAVHPALQLLAVPGGSDRCCLEPDKPCVGSGQCRTFGH